MLYINSCCCTCLSTENLQNVETKDNENIRLLDKLMFCLAEKDSIIECAPLLMCGKCNVTLTEMHDFKKSALKTLEQIKNCLKQLIRAPFSDLSIIDNNKTTEASVTTTITTTTNEVRQQIQQPTTILVNTVDTAVKIEPIIQNDSESEDQDEYIPIKSRETRSRTSIQDGASTSNSDNQNSSLKIHTVESLNKSYERKLDFHSKPTSKSIRKGNTCEPCGKRFVRDDFYIKHILTCSKNDISTKNSVLNWATKQEKVKIVRGPNSTTFQIISKTKEKKKDMPKTKVVNPIKKQDLKVDKYKNMRGPLEKINCPHCKKLIAKRFMKRHSVKCNREREDKKENLLKEYMDQSETESKSQEIVTPKISISSIKPTNSTGMNSENDENNSNNSDLSEAMSE